MSSKNNIRLSCDEANHTCDKTQYNDASLWEKIKLNIHLLYCSACRKYTKSNSKLSSLMKGKEVQVMPSQTKENLKSAFEKELENHK